MQLIQGRENWSTVFYPISQDILGGRILLRKESDMLEDKNLSELEASITSQDSPLWKNIVMGNLNNSGHKLFLLGCTELLSCNKSLLFHFHRRTKSQHEQGNDGKDPESITLPLETYWLPASAPIFQREEDENS